MRYEKRLQVAFVVALVAVGVAGQAFAAHNRQVQMGLDVQFHNGKRMCTPAYSSCADINQVRTGICDDLDVIVVVYHYAEITWLEYGVSWSGDYTFCYFWGFHNCADWFSGGADLGGWISCRQSWFGGQYSADPPPGTSGIGVGWMEVYCYGPVRFDIVPSDQGNLQVLDINLDADPVAGIHPGFYGGMQPGPDDLAPCDIVTTGVPPEPVSETSWGGVKTLFR